MPHSYSSLLVHVIFSTKGRARSLDPSIRPDLFAYRGGIVREMRGAARLINGTEDHVHMLLSLPADIAVAECLRVVKTNSSRWVHETFARHRSFAWQKGYGAFKVSVSNEKQVFKYIQDLPLFPHSLRCGLCSIARFTRFLRPLFHSRFAAPSFVTASCAVGYVLAPLRAAGS